MNDVVSQLFGRRWHMQYLLDEQGNPVPAPATHCGLLAAAWLLRNIKKRRVARTVWCHRGREFEVSTVFLVHNHDLSGIPGTPPVLWETMVFAPHSELDGVQLRYTSKFDAIKGHKATVECIKARLRLWRQPPSPRRRRVAARRIAQGQSVLRK